MYLHIGKTYNENSTRDTVCLRLAEKRRAYMTLHLVFGLERVKLFRNLNETGGYNNPTSL
jgi:hypothetical protein